MKKQQQQQQQQHKKGGNSSSSVEKRLQHTNEDLQAKESESKKVAAELRAKVSECRALGKALETEGTEYLEDVKRKLQSVDSVVMKLKFQLKEVSRLKAQIKKRQTERSKHHKSRSAPRKNAKKAEEKEKEKEKEKEEEKEGEEEEEEENVTIKESGEDALEDARMLQELHEEERSIKATLRAIAPTSGGVLAQWFIGSVNLKLYGENEKFLMKTRYENFKGWSLLYFASLVLRENILYANGSNIRQWWIVHHYISLFTSFVFLIWPESSTQFQQFRTYYLIYLSYLIIVQYMQSMYQLGRLYNLVALGKAGDMDVTGEVPTPAMGSGSSAAPTAAAAPEKKKKKDVVPRRSRLFVNLDIVYPFITFGHLCQLFNAYKLAKISYESNFTEWQAYVGAISFAVLGICNLTATTKVYFGKKKRKTN